MPTKEAIDRRDSAPVERKEIVTKEGTVSYGLIQHEGTDKGSPVFFLPGYGEEIGTITPVSRNIAKANESGGTRKVLLIRHSRREFKTEDLTLKKLQNLYQDASPKAWLCPPTTLRRAHEAILVLEKEKTKAHLAGHSYGGMTALCVALLRPDLVESITLLNTGGLVGKSRETDLGNQYVLFIRLAIKE